MSNFKRMHLIAGTMAILLLMWFYPMLADATLQNWKSGLKLTSSVAILGYTLGCLCGLAINFFLEIFPKRWASKYLGGVETSKLKTLVKYWSVLSKEWRRGPESNRRIEDLQSPALPLGYRAMLQSGIYLLNLATPSKLKAPRYPLQIICILIHSLFITLKNH